MRLDPVWLAQQGDDAALLAAIDTSFAELLPKRVGIAVSGGGDSMALLHLFARWAAQTGHAIAAVTVDHGLRAGSRAEAEGVAQFCQGHGIEHEILTWSRPAGAGNLPAEARSGRYELMAQWAQARGIGGIALGHTADDGAENFLMRLGRAAGLEGLAQMHHLFERGGIHWARPLWQHARADLRRYLQRHGVGWAEDPSNDDPSYQRTKVRRALPLLADIGIDASRLQQSATALRQAQAALAHYTRVEAARHVTQEGGDLLFPQRMTTVIPCEVERRMTVAALQWVGSNPYPPRRPFSGVLAHVMAQQDRATVAGCIIMRRKGAFRITREYNAVKDMRCPTDSVWDRRWRLDGPHAPDLQVRALGEAVRALPDWRSTDLPRRTLMASPAVWRGDMLVAAPVAGYNPDWTVQIVADFTSFLLSH